MVYGESKSEPSTKKGTEKYNYLKSLIGQKLPKYKIKKLFMKKFRCHHSTFYDWWDRTYYNRLSGRMINNVFKTRKRTLNRKYVNSKNLCYFCYSSPVEEAHLIYGKYELIVKLCKRCHGKYDSLQRLIKLRKECELAEKFPTERVSKLPTNEKEGGLLSKQEY